MSALVKLRLRMVYKRARNVPRPFGKKQLGLRNQEIEDFLPLNRNFLMKTGLDVRKAGLPVRDM